MRAALEQAAATPDPALSTPTEPAAIAQVPAADPTSATPPTADKKGPIPFEVHDTALKNAREKTRTEVLAEVDRDLGWAKQIPRASVEHMSNIAQRMTSDPIGFLETYEAELRDHPVYGPQLLSRAGRQLASGRGSAPVTEPAPDVEIHDAQGQVIGKTYSETAQHAREAWLKQQWLADVNREYGPLKAERDQRQADEQKAAEAHRQTEARADAAVAEVQEIVNNDDALVAEVAKAITEHPDWSVRKAALHVRDTKLRAPQLEGQAQQRVVDNFKHKAAGNTANGAGTTATPTKPRDREGLRKFLESASS